MTGGLSGDPAWDEITGKYVDADGRPISLREWAPLYENFEGRILAEDPLPGGTVLRTVWTGMLIPDCGAYPFGTAECPARDAPAALGAVRERGTYCTRATALAGHAAHLAAARAGAPAAAVGGVMALDPDQAVAQLATMAPGSAAARELLGRLPPPGGGPAPGPARPPGAWHCGHWRDKDGPCCGCGKPAPPGGVRGEITTEELLSGPCPGGLPYR